MLSGFGLAGAEPAGLITNKIKQKQELLFKIINNYCNININMIMNMIIMLVKVVIMMMILSC